MVNKIALAYGDGIGPEITESLLKIFREAKVNLAIDTIEVGEKLYTKGYSSGITPSSWETLLNNKVLLKAPITTPSGSGYKSLNVTLRKGLGLHTNIRPCRSFMPYVNSYSKDADVVIFRENEEDLYIGVEYQLTNEVFESLKLVSSGNCFGIINAAFEYAVKHNRKKVTCFVKDNIMKISDGIFAKTFFEVAKHYPTIEAEKLIIDIGTARIAKNPENFDVAVTTNLYGDIISDVVAEMLGSIGMCGSANIGDDFAMFEAVHGSAPDIAGKNIANPSGLINAAIMMLNHIEMNDKATLIENAWLKTIEDGMHTADIYSDELSTKKVSCSEFTDNVINNLGLKSSNLIGHNVSNNNINSIKPIKNISTNVKKEQVGIDVFLDYPDKNVLNLSKKIEELTVNTTLKLQLISVKGLMAWPNNINKKNISNFYRCRFVADIKSSADKTVTKNQIVELLSQLLLNEIDIVKTETLYIYDGKLGFSLAQGE